LFGQDDKKQIRAAVANELLEFCAIVDPILQRPQLTNEASVTAVADRAEVL